MNKPVRILKTVSALGVKNSALNALYQGLVRIGWYRAFYPVHKVGNEKNCGTFHPLPTPKRAQLLPFLERDTAVIEKEAETILSGKFHPFMGEKTEDLSFLPINGTRHWSASGRFRPEDIKLIWEPARFCWVDPLMRLEALKHDGRADAAFRALLDDFTRKNPVNAGENWESAQEAAVRLINLAFAASFFSNIMNEPSDSVPKSVRERIRQEYAEKLPPILAAHARRIPSTMIYAESQRNNHLLSEAVGLMTAAVVLPDAKDAKRWWRLGTRTLFRGLDDQIAPDGCYIQLSTNYHRMVLQLIIWADRLLRLKDLPWPEALLPKIRRSIRWLDAHTDQISGTCCDTGHNDGTLLFAFGTPYQDYRATLNTAAVIFENGAPDETALWLDAAPRKLPPMEENTRSDHTVLKMADASSLAVMNVSSCFGRPAHADGLHTEIWFNGRKEILDPGTYRYSAPNGWENRLKSASAHNGLVINGREPMSNAGKFLWLDWDSSRTLCNSNEWIEAEHTDGIEPDLKTIRKIERCPGGFRIQDSVTAGAGNALSDSIFQLHWILPDQKYKAAKDGMIFERIRIRFECDAPYELHLIRGGKSVFAAGNTLRISETEAFLGWYSPTYNEKREALSLILTCRSALPFQLQTIITGY